MKYYMREVGDFGELVREAFGAPKREFIRTYFAPELWATWWEPWVTTKKIADRNLIFSAASIKDRRLLTLDHVYLREATSFEDFVFGEDEKLSSSKIEVTI